MTQLKYTIRQLCLIETTISSLKLRCSQALLIRHHTVVKNRFIKYCETTYESEGKNLFWSITNSSEVLNKFKSKCFKASKLSIYDFFTLYTILPHHLIKDKLIDLTEQTFSRQHILYLACNEECTFSLLMSTKIINCGLTKKFVKHLFISWIMILLDLELNFIDKL